MKKILIIGSDGQDAKIIYNKLNNYNNELILYKKNEINLCSSDVIKSIIKKTQFDYIYYMAAFHHSSESHEKIEKDILLESINVNSTPILYFLKYIYEYSPRTKFFYPSSSLIFKNNGLKNENSQINANCPYSLSKIIGMNYCNYFRVHMKIFASIGIFFNHESEYRKKNFFTKKIITNLVKIYKKKQSYLEVGSLKKKVDMGYAYDYMEAVVKIMNHKKPDNFVIATGKLVTLKDFVKIAFSYFNLDYKKYVKINTDLNLRKNYEIYGDISKIKKKVGWYPKTSLKEMISHLINAELNK